MSFSPVAKPPKATCWHGRSTTFANHQITSRPGHHASVTLNLPCLARHSPPEKPPRHSCAKVRLGMGLVYEILWSDCLWRCVWPRKLAVPRPWLRASSWEVAQEELFAFKPATSVICLIIALLSAWGSR